MSRKQQLQKLLKAYYHNRKGWKTKRRIVVFQSDDWGSIRMPSVAAFEKLKGFGVEVEKCPYMQFDTLASKTDLVHLEQVLRSHVDCIGRHPVFTVNFLTRNPDFKAIEVSGFKAYSSHRINDVAADKHLQAVELPYFEYLTKEGLFFPQLHGREHLNIERWLRYLQEGNSLVHFAFKEGFWGISRHTASQIPRSLQAALDFDQSHHEAQLVEVINDACGDFKEIFGFSSKSFIAPNYIYSTLMDSVLHKQGVQYLQSGKMRLIPLGAEKYSRQWVFTGDRNQLGQIYLVRNVRFEPAESKDTDWVKQALLEINAAFTMNHPAIIDTHRVNYIGSLKEANREQSLEKLDQLLVQLKKRWLDIEFLNTQELGELISTG
ncbi:hypothetical protein [Flagellimonas marinaquae]